MHRTRTKAQGARRESPDHGLPELGQAAMEEVSGPSSTASCGGGEPRRPIQHLLGRHHVVRIALHQQPGTDRWREGALDETMHRRRHGHEALHGSFALGAQGHVAAEGETAQPQGGEGLTGHEPIHGSERIAHLAHAVVEHAGALTDAAEVEAQRESRPCRRTRARGCTPPCSACRHPGLDSDGRPRPPPRQVSGKSRSPSRSPTGPLNRQASVSCLSLMGRGKPPFFRLLYNKCSLPVRTCNPLIRALP